MTSEHMSYGRELAAMSPFVKRAPRNLFTYVHTSRVPVFHEKSGPAGNVIRFVGLCTVFNHVNVVLEI